MEITTKLYAETKEDLIFIVISFPQNCGNKIKKLLQVVEEKINLKIQRKKLRSISKFKKK